MRPFPSLPRIPTRRVRLLIVATLTVVTALPAHGQIQLDSCYPFEFESEGGWLQGGILRDVDKPNKQLLPIGPQTTTTTDAATQMESAVRHAVAFFRDDLKPKTTPASPKPWEKGVDAPPKLLCAEDPGTNTYKYALFPDTISAHTLGEYYAPGPVISITPDIRVDPSVVSAYGQLFRASGSPDSDHIVTPAHELFHAIQAGHRMFTSPMLDCDSSFKVCTQHWVSDGIADAMAHAWLRHYEKEELFDGSNIKIDRTLPRLDLPFHKVPDKSDEAYAVSLFWEYLAWEPRYIRDEMDKLLVSGTLAGLRPEPNKSVFDPRLILRFMNMGDVPHGIYDHTANRQKAWELEWLEKVLASALDEARTNLHVPIPRKPKGGLWVVYPKYAAWLVAHQTNGRPDAEINTRLTELFNGVCDVVTMIKGTASDLTLSVPNLGTYCVALDRPGPNDLVDITLRGSQALRDRIHIGWNGEVIPPHRRGNRSAKRWTVGLPLGPGTPSATGNAMILAVSNVPENTKPISNLPYDYSTPAGTQQIKLVFRIR